ncbi:MAG: hypothetical protein Q7K39_01040 [Candidatus Magasanikbacteria bacterium]|nr:hypothetical protein [Candidatus Magasanikbacteria bacterium]
MKDRISLSEWFAQGEKIKRGGEPPDNFRKEVQLIVPDDAGWQLPGEVARSTQEYSGPSESLSVSDALRRLAAEIELIREDKITLQSGETFPGHNARLLLERIGNVVFHKTRRSSESLNEDLQIPQEIWNKQATLAERLAYVKDIKKRLSRLLGEISAEIARQAESKESTHKPFPDILPD